MIEHFYAKNDHFKGRDLCFEILNLIWSVAMYFICYDIVYNFMSYNGVLLEEIGQRFLRKIYLVLGSDL